MTAARALTAALPYLVALMTLTSLWSQHAEVVQLRDVVTPILIIGFTVSLGLGVLRAATRDHVRSSLTLAVVAIPVTTFGHQLHLLDWLSNAATLRWPLLVTNVVVVIAAVVAIWRSTRPVESVAMYAGIVALAFHIVSLPGIIAGAPVGNEPAHARSGSATTTHPDIYYIVVDGYGRGDVLRQLYGFDNRPFLSALEEKGFYVASDAYANYAHTQLSLASSLNMRYVDELPATLTGDVIHQIAPLLAAPEVVTRLQDLGYRYVHFATPWWGTADAPLADVSYDAGVGSEFEAVYFRTTFIGQLLPSSSWQEAHLQTLSHLRTVATLEEPTFAFAHILLPHPPFVFGADGTLLRHDVELGGSWQDVNGHLEQLRFLNTWLDEVLTDILAASAKEPIIMLQADHGPGRAMEVNLKHGTWERMAILNAYLVPDSMREELYPGVSPVNSFRTLLRTQFDVDLPNLGDRSKFSWPGSQETFVDVTHEMERP